MTRAMSTKQAVGTASTLSAMWRNATRGGARTQDELGESVLGRWEQRSIQAHHICHDGCKELRSTVRERESHGGAQDARLRQRAWASLRSRPRARIGRSLGSSQRRRSSASRDSLRGRCRLARSRASWCHLVPPVSAPPSGRSDPLLTLGVPCARHERSQQQPWRRSPTPIQRTCPSKAGRPAS